MHIIVLIRAVKKRCFPKKECGCQAWVALSGVAGPAVLLVIVVIVGVDVAVVVVVRGSKLVLPEPTAARKQVEGSLAYTVSMWR